MLSLKGRRSAHPSAAPSSEHTATDTDGSKSERDLAGQVTASQPLLAMAMATLAPSLGPQHLAACDLSSPCSRLSAPHAGWPRDSVIASTARTRGSVSSVAVQALELDRIESGTMASQMIPRHSGLSLYAGYGPAGLVAAEATLYSPSVAATASDPVPAASTAGERTTCGAGAAGGPSPEHDSAAVGGLGPVRFGASTATSLDQLLNLMLSEHEYCSGDNYFTRRPSHTSLSHSDAV